MRKCHHIECWTNPTWITKFKHVKKTKSGYNAFLGVTAAFSWEMLAHDENTGDISSKHYLSPKCRTVWRRQPNEICTTFLAQLSWRSRKKDWILNQDSCSQHTKSKLHFCSNFFSVVTLSLFSISKNSLL